jgi:hypothetical protein
VNVAVFELAGTVTEGGTNSRALLSVNRTVAPLSDLRLKVTVQVLEAPEASDVGVHPSDDMTSVGASRNVACWEMPAHVAVTVAYWEYVTVPADAVNVAEDFPPATVTEAGTVSALLLLESEMAIPPEGAA